MQKNYVIYHLHSDMSSGVTSIDSVTKYWQYIDRAKECGMKAMAFSEHGSVFAWYEKKCAMEKAGIKYIHAEEFYVTEKIDREPNGDPVKIRDNWHCVLIAKNYEGVKEINRLASKSFNRKDGHYYYVPRIELSDLLNTSDNIIITSACVAGIYGKASDEIQKRFIDFMIKHKDRCYLEIQHHNVEKQIVYNQKMLELSQKYGLNLIAGTDTHCLNETHAKGRVMLQRSKHIFFEDEVGWDLTFKTYDELVKAYQTQGSLPEEVYLQAIENTNIMADEIEEFEVDRCIKYPHIYSDPERVFKEKVNRACKEHAYALKNHSVQEISKRVSEEFEVYKKVGAIDFMLLETYLREWEQTQGIQRGYSRGSVSGSFIAYLLGITEMDSLKFDLNFFRFLNPSRVTNSDIDTDFCEQDRAKVKEFLLRDKMNLKTIHTSEIITFNTIATKGAIKDMCRAMEIPLDKAQELSDMVDTDGSIPDKVRKEYPELCSYVDIVSGTIVSIGSHPSGVLVSDLDIEADVGLCSLSTSEYPVSMLDMHSLDTLMYVKLDVLGLDNIGVINETCKLVGIDRLTPDNVDLNDEEVWKDIRDDTTLIFQWESDSAQAYLKKFMSDETLEKAKEINPNFSYIKWFSFGNGLIRPGCASFRDDVAEGNIHTTGFKEFDDFLAITLGRITMQEDIMRFCKRFCGYTDAESDTVRRCVDENTDVMMGDGNIKKIKDISVGDYVQSYNEYGVSECKKVVGVYDNGFAETYRIKANNGHEIVGTPTHKVLTQRGYVCISDLTVNDVVMVPYKINAMSDGLKPSKRLAESTMFMIGLLIGDGTLGGDSGICFTNHEDALIEKYKQCVKSLSVDGDCEFSVKSQDGVTVDKIHWVFIKTKNYRDSLRNLIKRLGLAVKSGDKHIPDCIMKYPKGGKISNLLAGLFDTDGGYNIKAECIEYSSKSKKLVMQIRSLLLKYGIYSYINEKSVAGYDYKNNVLRISQPKSLERFRDDILPLMIGEKRAAFEGVINSCLSNENAYNYRLPNECRNEIFDMSEKTHTSINSAYKRFGKTSCRLHKEDDGITDVKAMRILTHIYCPLTYRMMMNDYIPMRIKEIEYVGTRHVYDIEVEDNHNYIANGIIVHNCIAKKKGTQDILDEMHDRFVKYSHDQYHVDEALLEEIFPPIKQGILDASQYAFSWNHSDAYSCIGYISGYLRHYYPLEFLTASLNVFADKFEKTTEIVNYMKKRGVALKPIKFRESKADYYLDKANKEIYKGMLSVKFMNRAVADKLYEMRNDHFDSFVDLLKVFPGNSKQRDILISLDFFSEFGKAQKLKDICAVYDKYEGKKILKKDGDIDIEEARSFASGETEKQLQFTPYDISRYMNHLIDKIPDKDISIAEHVNAQREFLGHCDIMLPEERGKACVLDVDVKYSPRLDIYKLDTGEQVSVKVAKRAFANIPLKEGDIITYRTEDRPAVRKTEDGFEEIPGKFTTWLAWYGVSRIENNT